MDCKHKYTKRALARWNKTFEKDIESDVPYCSVIDYCTNCGFITEFHRPTKLGKPLIYEEGLERFKENNWKTIDIPHMMAMYI